ncbi:MAG: MATE family efflux transporter [Lachnospiraceae bacterium]|nr:MATE family efflux transporter [Lachnospiraceae bacterium]
MSEAITSRRERILTQPILPLLIRMSIPTIIGMLIMTIYNLTDTFFIGQLGNKSMTAAIGIAFSFVSFIQALGFWFGYGSGNSMSRALGAKEEKQAITISSTGLLLATISGILLTVLLLPVCESLAAFLGGNASEDLLRYSTEYIRIILYSVPVSIYATALYNQIRLCGNAKDAMLGLMLGMLLNMVLDPIFIFTLKMGFVGAGWATFAGQVAGASMLTFLSFKNGNIHVSFTKFQLNKTNLYHILIGGAPNFSRQGITSFAAILLNISAAAYGEEVIAALTVAGRIAAMCYMVVIGWGQGFQPICAMNYGAKKYDRVKKALTLSALVGTIFLIIADIAVFCGAHDLVSLLTKNPEVAYPAVTILRLQCISLPLMGIYALSSMFMQNIGRYYTALIISVSRQGLFYIPLLYILPLIITGGNPLAIYLVQPLADIFAFVLGLILAWPAFRDLLHN